MPRPFFMNLIDVKFLLLTRSDRLNFTSSTPVDIPVVIIDEDFREPIGTKIYGSESGEGVDKLLQAQVSYKQTELRELSQLGEHPVSDGHLVFRTSDLAAITNQDEVPRKGDRIVAVRDDPASNFRDVDYKIIHVQPKGHIGFNSSGIAAGVGQSVITLMFFEENREEVEVP